MTESRVGSKGEIFPPKEIREKLGLRPRTRIKYKVENGKLVVEPIPSVRDLLREPHEVETTIREFGKFRRSLSRKAER